jgi:hypothetical protein
VIVFPRGDQHVMASDPQLVPVPIQDIYSQPSMGQINVVKYGGAGPPARFICGFLHSDQRFDPLLKSLPAVLCARSRADTFALETFDGTGRRVQPVTQPQEKEWWRASLRYLISETATPGPGNRAVLARLAESLFLQLLRWQLQYAAQGHGGGWLAGLYDAQVGPAHVASRPTGSVVDRRDTGQRKSEYRGRHSPNASSSWWGVAHCVSRRLADAPGTAPAAESTLGMGEIAARVGYESDAAFNRAFRRRVGSPPATWRQARDLSTEAKPAD